MAAYPTLIDLAPAVSHLDMSSRKPSKYGSKFRSGGGTPFNSKRTKTVGSSTLKPAENTSQDEKFEAIKVANGIDETMDFLSFESGDTKVGWLCNMHSTTIEDSKITGGRAGVNYYFLGEDGESFKATVEYDPYFLVAIKMDHEADVEEWCQRMFEGVIKNVKRVEKEDLQMPNHLMGYRRTFLRLSFANVTDLLSVRRTIQPIAEKNKKGVNAMDTYEEISRFVSLI